MKYEDHVDYIRRSDVLAHDIGSSKKDVDIMYNHALVPRVKVALEEPAALVSSNTFVPQAFANGVMEMSK